MQREIGDAARSLITPRQIKRVFSAAQKHDAAVLAAPVTDTLKFTESNYFVSGCLKIWAQAWIAM
jgi:2-C-methyl-D-erythritol 4-phosphate cytidylyltransferase